MKNKTTLIVLALVLAVFLVGASVLYKTLTESIDADQLATEATQETEAELMQAPDFTVYDANGKAVKLSDYIGKPVVLNFWASWCGPCQSEMPDFQKTYEELGGEVQFLMVNATGGRETVDSAKAFIEKAGYTFPVFYDTNEEACIAYGISSLPTTYFIDAEGRGVARATGAISEKVLLEGIGMITK